MGEDTEELDPDCWPPLVVDFGCRTIKCGFSGETSPRSKFPSCIGSPRYSSTLAVALDSRDEWIGHEAFRKRAVLSLRWPVENARSPSAADIASLVRHSLAEAADGVDPSSCPLCLILPWSSCGNALYSAITEAAFDWIGFPSFALMDQVSSCVYAMNHHTGIIVVSGHKMTCALPVIDGEAQFSVAVDVPFGGYDLTEYLGRLLMEERGFNLLESEGKRECLRHLKEEHCFLRLKSDCESLPPAFHELEDGQEVRLDDERWLCPEAMFDPKPLGLKAECALQHAVVRAGSAAGKEAMESVVLAGGNALFANMPERLEVELDALGWKSSVTVSPWKESASWLGASVCCSHPPGPLFMDREAHE